MMHEQGDITKVVIRNGEVPAQPNVGCLPFRTNYRAGCPARSKAALSFLPWRGVEIGLKPVLCRFFERVPPKDRLSLGRRRENCGHWFGREGTAIGCRDDIERHLDDLAIVGKKPITFVFDRSEEHTSELQSRFGI